MGKSDVVDEYFSLQLPVLCIHNMPATRTRLVFLSTSLCGRLGQDLTSAPNAKRTSHEYGRYPDVAHGSIAFTETIKYRDKGPNLYSQSSEYTII